jgi:hypothetical protein
MAQAKQSVPKRPNYALALNVTLQTLLEKIKTLYNDTPGLSPDKIGPTVGQNSAISSVAE